MSRPKAKNPKTYTIRYRVDAEDFAAIRDAAKLDSDELAHARLQRGLVAVPVGPHEWSKLTTVYAARKKMGRS